MKKLNRKRLNNKGFTLVELLAVVVILAVVMGIAATSVLSSMNNSRKGSLVNSAESVSQIFQTKYSEAMVMNKTASVLGVYDFTVVTPVVYYLSEGAVAEDLNLSAGSYELSSSSDTKKVELAENRATSVTDSFIVFKGDKVVACMIAKKGGSYYVGDAAVKENSSFTVAGVNLSVASGTMYACSNEQKSWTD